MSIVYPEDTLFHQTTAECLKWQLGWGSVFAYNNEDFEPDILPRLMNGAVTS